MDVEEVTKESASGGGSPSELAGGRCPRGRSAEKSRRSRAEDVGCGRRTPGGEPEGGRAPWPSGRRLGGDASEVASWSPGGTPGTPSGRKEQGRRRGVRREGPRKARSARFYRREHWYRRPRNAPPGTSSGLRSPIPCLRRRHKTPNSLRRFSALFDTSRIRHKVLRAKDLSHSSAPAKVHRV